ncbi:hypothetical protein KP509_13G043700 [Ceratopteris richardii]|uniref:Uncharacterized protein n=1 Tax=Ceratopteris richardii TaxID=49495 RepID=A0A8T2TFB5_CERRI|nr:hypothetical protein KP509_13G043700 [Ceratopteris richardii]
MRKKPGQEWDYVNKMKALTKGQHRCKCNFCGHVWDGGANRIRANILGLKGYGVGRCDNARQEAKDICRKLQAKGSNECEDASYAYMQSNEDSILYGSNRCYTDTHESACQMNASKRKKESSGALQKAWESQARLEADKALRRFFFAEDIPFWKVRNPYLVCDFHWKGWPFIQSSFI